LPFPVAVDLFVLEIHPNCRPSCRSPAPYDSIFKNRTFVAKFCCANLSPSLIFCRSERFPSAPLPMANNFSQNYAPEIVGGVAVEVAGYLIGRSLIDSFRKSFTSKSQTQLGDYFMDQSRVLLQSHLQLIRLDERNKIHQSYELLV